MEENRLLILTDTVKDVHYYFKEQKTNSIFYACNIETPIYGAILLFSCKTP